MITIKLEFLVLGVNPDEFNTSKEEYTEIIKEKYEEGLLTKEDFIVAALAKGLDIETLIDIK